MKLEIAVRKIHKNMIITGVLMSEKLKAGNLSAMKIVGHKVDENNLIVFVDKKSLPIHNPYSENFDNLGLTEFVTKEIWQKFRSPEPKEFGGIMLARDNLLFSDEDASKVSRAALISVVDLNELTFEFEHHAVFRSVKCDEYDDMLVFAMKKDNEDDTQKLVSSLIGDALSSFYSKPFWTRDNGERYRLKSTNSALINSLYKMQIVDISQQGKLSKETEEAIDGHYVNMSEDESYRQYLINMSARCPFFLDGYDRLLTEAENQMIADEADRYLKEQMEE